MGSLNEILPGQLYLGDLGAARSLRAAYQITHLLSVCTDLEAPANGVDANKHCVIAITDSHYANLLEHLPRACEFIEGALSSGGVILVHCQMGMSRSAATVAAYLMKTKGISVSEALRFIKEKRPTIMPNDGFMQQLDVWTQCGYDPSPDQPAYAAWKAKHDDSIAKFKQRVVNVIPVVPGQLYFSSGFPRESDEAKEPLEEHKISHIVIASPSEVDVKNVGSREVLTIGMANQPEKLLVSLPEVADFIDAAIKSGGTVLVHCLVVSRASTMLCAYFMSSRKISPHESAELLKDSIPLFTLSPYLQKHLEVHEKCDYNPTREHPLVKQWMSEPP